MRSHSDKKIYIWIIYPYNINNGCDSIPDVTGESSVKKAYASSLVKCEQELQSLEAERKLLKQKISRTKKHILLSFDDAPSGELRKLMENQRCELKELSSCIKEVKKKITSIQNYLNEDMI